MGSCFLVGHIRYSQPSDLGSGGLQRDQDPSTGQRGFLQVRQDHAERACSVSECQIALCRQSARGVAHKGPHKGQQRVRLLRFDLIKVVSSRSAGPFCPDSAGAVILYIEDVIARVDYNFMSCRGARYSVEDPSARYGMD